MRGFPLLCLGVGVAFLLTLSLDVFQRNLAHPGRETIIFASMWAPGEPMQDAYARLFEAFEKEYPRYRVEPRWDGRWVLPAIRPRLLTGSDVPDVLGTDRESLRILAQEGFLEPLDAELDALPHPDDAGRKLREAFVPSLLERCTLEPPPEAAAKMRKGTYLLPSGTWTTFIFYNRAHYERFKLPIPKTWSQFLDNCRLLDEAGIAPFAADRDVYAGLWSDALLRRAVPEETLQATVEGAPGAPRFDMDPRYRAAFQAIRDLHRPGWHIEGWRGSQWPAAQRLWVGGKATHLICGSWIIRETLEYKPNANVFRIGGFLCPALDTVDSDGRPLPLGDPSAVDASLSGHALLKGGRHREGALELLRFLARRSSGEMLAKIGKEIPTIAGAPFPSELEEIRADLQAAKTIYKGGANTYAPKWAKFVWNDLYQQFFMHADERDPRYLSVEAFLKKLQQSTDAYRAQGGEAGIR
ncbi:MAG: carbohydrate ABC transporter substrate-binding protein [Planctomycetota bacterium]|nr:carbohydrate ABC transporter substrate-binding protein [Planctomycetota bacterium]